MNKSIDSKSTRPPILGPLPHRSHANSSRHSPARPSIEPKYHSRQVSWPGSKNRMTITAWNDDAQGPGCAITYHDATVTQTRSKDGEPYKALEIDLAPFGSNYGSGTIIGDSVSYERAITDQGEVVVPPALVGSETNPFQEHRLVLPAGNSYSSKLLNNGENGDRPYDSHGFGGGSSRQQPESRVGYEARKVLNDLWSKLDMQETQWWQLPLKCTSLQDLTSGKFVSSEGKATLACPVQFIFSQEPLKEKDIQAGRDLHLPPVASSHDPPFEEESYWRNRSPYSDVCHVTLPTPEIEGVTVLDSYDVKYSQVEIERQERVAKYDPSYHSTSPIDNRPSITVIKGTKTGQPWMRVKYNTAAIRKPGDSLSLLSSSKAPETGDVELVPFPVRDTANFSVQTLTGPDGEVIELHKLFEKKNSTEVPSHTAYAWPSPSAPSESLTWVEHGDHRVLRTLATVIKSLGPEWSSLPCSELAIKGLRNSEKQYYHPEQSIQIPVSLTYTYCHKEPEVEEPEELAEEERQPIGEDPNEEPPPYSAAQTSVTPIGDQIAPNISAVADTAPRTEPTPTRRRWKRNFLCF